MKKNLLMLFFFSVFLSGISSAWAETPMTAQAKADVGSGVWVSLYGGYDFAHLGKIANAAISLVRYADITDADTGAAKTDHSGLLAGGQVGLNLDQANSLSLGVERTWTSQLDAGFTSGPDVPYYEKMDPTLLGITMNYALVLLDGGGSKTLLTLGGGFYHASVHYDSNTQTGVTEIGDFAQDNIGGTVGVSEEMSLGGGLSLGLDAKFRGASPFNNLQSNNLTGNGAAQPGNYVLKTAGASHYYEVNPISTAGPSPGGYHQTVLDYTGFEGNIGLKLAL